MTDAASDRPSILVVDDGSRGPLLGAELTARYGKDYAVRLELSATAVSSRLRELAEAHHPVALVLGIYARETGQGMLFQDEGEAPPPAAGGASDSGSRPKLRVIK